MKMRGSDIDSSLRTKSGKLITLKHPNKFLEILFGLFSKRKINLSFKSIKPMQIIIKYGKKIV